MYICIYVYMYIYIYICIYIYVYMYFRQFVLPYVKGKDNSGGKKKVI